MPTPDVQRKTLQHTLAALSKRLSVSALPMQPFVRFGQDSAQKNMLQRYWDFGYEVQKRLLAGLYQIASADEIADLGVYQWKRNLGVLLKSRRAMLEEFQDGASHPDWFSQVSPKFKLVVDRLAPGARLLYIGAGSGTECLELAANGLRVVGIDTIVPLLAVGREWAALLKRDAEFAGMDVLALGFAPASFDSFTLEFYGSWPAPREILELQRGLARLLKPGGMGFITALRKRYASYWYLMGSLFPSAMTNWLIPYSRLDFLFSDPDGAEERLMFGLYNRCHTVKSLADELRWTFEVVECRADPDPRYLTAVVRQRPDVDLNPPPSAVEQAAPPDVSPAAAAEVEALLLQVARLIDQLEDHTRQVVRYFESGGEARECLTRVKPDLPALAAQLDTILRT